MEDIVKLRNLVVMKGTVVIHKVEKGSTYTTEYDFKYLNQLNGFIQQDLDAKTLQDLLMNDFAIQRKYVDGKLVEKKVIFFREVEW